MLAMEPLGGPVGVSGLTHKPGLQFQDALYAAANGDGY